ncbi:proton-coupled amino acid transporter-like protein CG1139 [Topomyia yanbarensis]|uniref:proton-coupled amino acid transporter-like protein CG1139 n=1 Tax=Topomyia yanbarensis TaxID=2498891 RepID=UPI00273A89FC|nr:proton-coupled amino acid transporter-like protein CG1139 [Topomyia yanbarensis]XP_058832733.1 proton-coupled amino acid transporter-like protein CG1139 [Topomyia yanbarensis]XP_058832739.1 proton-coupled amino acid transporter-like protein CG1139 [Topomyia yanbarensis]XP_058832743.1 proton-coupled amino acid transporter-like protein CG1139 [Topomyia yanbarensis]XP_058832752.1 proton-coupled amino acid transporter-like protein CG1139 [Topomyia yanbarensis]XP_058832761.1 proton-coupled amino
MAPNVHDLETAPLLDENSNDQRLKPSPLDTPLSGSPNKTQFYGSTTNQWQKIVRYDPLQHRKLDNPTTNLDTLMHMLNGNLGTGILAMPNAFKNSGLYVGFFGIFIMGVICTHSMHILVRCSHELCRRYQVPSISFSEMGRYAFESGPNALYRLGRLVGVLINCFLMVMQIGFCCVYYLFVAVNLCDFLAYLSIQVDVLTVLLCLLVPLTAMNMIRTLKYLTPTSLVASVLAISGITIAFMFLLQDLPHSSSVAPISEWSTMPLYFGTAMYAFEGIGVILPLENNMKTPKDFCRWNGVLNTGMTIVICLYSSVGFYGYLKYGDDAQGSITLNLPNEELLAQLVRLLMATAVFASYALQFYVPMTIVGPAVRSWFDSQSAQSAAEYTARIALVLLTFTLAAIIPNLGAFISLVGAISTSMLALVFPPLIEIITYWPGRKYGPGNWILWKDIAICLFGLFGFFIGTSTSLVEIVTHWE